nr:phosphoenolpyruvate synthase [Desulfobulbaceae bacterium]
MNNEFIESDALKANLQETAVEDVPIDPSYAVLIEVVADFRGIQNSINDLLFEINHPFRNWSLVLPKLRAFILKHTNHYCKHDKGPEAYLRFFTIHLEAIDQGWAISKTKKSNPHQISQTYAPKSGDSILALAMESLLAYMDKHINLLDSASLKRYENVLNSSFEKLHKLDDQVLMYMVQSYHPVKKIAQSIIRAAGQNESPAVFDFQPFTKLYKKLLQIDYQYWLTEKDPLPWFVSECGHENDEWDVSGLFSAISHHKMTEHLTALDEKSAAKPKTAQELQRLLKQPDHIEIVRLYKEIPGKLLAVPFPNAAYPGSPEIREAQKKETSSLDKSGNQLDRFSENRKLLFLFRIMDTPGLFLIHEETLREINRSLVLLIHEQAFEEIEQFLLTTFQHLKANVIKFPHTSLQCIQVLGSEIFKKGSGSLVESFLWEVVRFGFQYANVTGVDEDWQPIANPAHLVNIRVWLNLIMQEPKWCSTLFSALIINLHLSGTCIKDTDLFQRDITELLNHPIEPIYNLAKQFAKLLPVFFNEIGAEGELREVSTELDESHSRKDVLIHFLRKQSHVESSNLIVDFIKAIFSFWRSRDINVLREFLPHEVLYAIKTTGPFIDDLHILMKRAFELPDLSNIEDLLDWDEKTRENFLAQQSDLNSVEVRRFSLLIHMYTLLYEKYNLGLQDLRHQLDIAVNSGFPEIEELIADLEICDTFQCLDAILTHLEKLQETILSDEIFEAKEDIYYKRHIAVDIPSVYGRYREKKFDAIGLTFRLENLANLYLEKIPDTVNLSFITEITFIRITKCLKLYLRALKIDGITSRNLETYVSLLESSVEQKRFSYTQYLDILRGLSSGVKDIIYAYYTNIHQNNLSIIIPQVGCESLLPRYSKLWSENDISGSIHRLSESFLRDLIAGTFGLQSLDNFITRIYQTLESQKEVLDESKLNLLMTYNPENVISSLHTPSKNTTNLILLGNKGYNLTQLAVDNKPVPAGFIITTEIFRCWPVVKDFFKARDEFMAQIRQSLTEVENKTGKRFGDPSNPLLVSVRSGAAVSMPGMMATLHDVGLNEDLAEEFAHKTGKEYLAWDNYRRFLQSWAMSKGIDREIFQTLMNEAKATHDVQVKRQFTPAQMKELSLNYQKAIRGIGIGIPDDPWLQLVGAIETVLDSWNTAKTKEYRSLMDVSDSWGTAVIIQEMVFGNLSPKSGSGVVFTAHPYRKVRRVALWGDYATADQGEDIVSGLVTTFPISVEQAEIDGRSKENSLETRFPKIYQHLRDIARDLVYEKHWNPQDIEFTFEGPEAADLHLLQTRDMITIKKKENFDAFQESTAMTRSILGKGIGVSGSALSGRAVFTVDNINRLRQEDPGTPLILVRQDTVPEDIKEISQADGLLTARGGQTSHASIVALRLEKTCVVGCKNLKVFEAEERCEISGREIRFGDPISIDGRKGLFLRGTHPINNEMHILPI